MALNDYQKNILEATLQFPLDSIDDMPDKSQSLKTFELILSGPLTLSNQNKLREWDALSEVKQMRDILEHPWPQNRSVSYPYVQGEPGMALWYPDEAEHIAANLCREPLGLLGLSARNNNTAVPVTKQDVVEYITDEINKRITALRSQGVIPAIIEEVSDIITSSPITQSGTTPETTSPIPLHIQPIFSNNSQAISLLTSEDASRGIPAISVGELLYLGQVNVNTLREVLEHAPSVRTHLSQGVTLDHFIRLSRSPSSLREFFVNEEGMRIIQENLHCHPAEMIDTFKGASLGLMLRHASSVRTCLEQGVTPDHFIRLSRSPSSLREFFVNEEGMRIIQESLHCHPAEMIDTFKGVSLELMLKHASSVRAHLEQGVTPDHFKRLSRSPSSLREFFVNEEGRQIIQERFHCHPAEMIDTFKGESLGLMLKHASSVRAHLEQGVTPDHFKRLSRNLSSLREFLNNERGISSQNFGTDRFSPYPPRNAGRSRR